MRLTVVLALVGCGSRTELAIVDAQDGGLDASCMSSQPIVDDFQDSGVSGLFCSFNVTWPCADANHLRRIEIHCTPSACMFTCIGSTGRVTQGGGGPVFCKDVNDVITTFRHACGQYEPDE